MNSSAPTDLFASGDRVLSLNPFDFNQRTRLVFGCGAFEQLGDLVRELFGRRVLVVTDEGLRKAGHCARAESILRVSGIDSVVFDQVHENPTTDDVERCTDFARRSGIDLIIGLGGGSSIDCAKGTNFLLSNGGKMQDYRGVGKAKFPMLSMIAVPTTSGTGSEAQSFAVIADSVTHMKMACGDKKAACRIALLDPELTMTMPHSVAAATGIDAITHAIESFVTVRRNLVSQMFARQAWTLLARAFPVVLREPDNLAARGHMQLGAFFAGAAIENSMLGSAHAAANPLTAHYNVTHGHAVGLMLPHVIRWNAPVVGSLYHELLKAAGWADADSSDETAAQQLADGLTDLLRMADVPLTITQAIVGDSQRKEIEHLAAEASQQWTGTFNPRIMDVSAYSELYRRAW